MKDVDLSPVGVFVATSWRNKCEKVCNGAKYGVTLPSISENRLHLSIERALCIRFALSLPSDSYIS